MENEIPVNFFPIPAFGNLRDYLRINGNLDNNSLNSIC